MYEDAYHDLAHDLIAEAVFAGHPLGRPVIGTADAVRGMDAAAVSDYHANRYVGPNIVVAAAGQPRARAAGAHDRAALRPVRAPSRPGRPACGRRGSTRSAPRRGSSRKASEQYHVCLGGDRAAAVSDQRRFAASLLDSMLGGSASSRLFQEIRERRGMAYSVYTFASQYADTGMIGVYVGTREDNLGECMRIVARAAAADRRGRPRPGRAATAPRRTSRAA